MEPIASTSALPYSPFPPPPATQQDLDCDDCLAGIALSTSATQDCPDCSPPSCCPPLPSFTDDCADCNVDTLEGAAGHLAFCCDDQSCLSPSFSSGLSLEAGLGLGVDDPDCGDASCSRGTDSNSGAGKGSPKTWQQLLASCTQCHDHGEGAVSGSIAVGQDGTGSGSVRRGTVADEWRLACKEAGCFDSFSFPPFATGSTTAAGSTGAAAAGVKDGGECPDCLSLPLSALASSSPHAPASASHCASFPFPLVPSISTPGLGLITSGDAHPAMSGHAACLSTSSSSGLFEPHAVVDEVGEGKGEGKNVAAGMVSAGNAAELEMDVEALLKGVDEETIREILECCCCDTALHSAPNSFDPSAHAQHNALPSHIHCAEAHLGPPSPALFPPHPHPPPHVHSHPHAFQPIPFPASHFQPHLHTHPHFPLPPPPHLHPHEQQHFLPHAHDHLHYSHLPVSSSTTSFPTFPSVFPPTPTSLSLHSLSVSSAPPESLLNLPSTDDVTATVTGFSCGWSGCLHSPFETNEDLTRHVMECHLGPPPPPLSSSSSCSSSGTVGGLRGEGEGEGVVRGLMQSLLRQEARKQGVELPLGVLAGVGSAVGGKRSTRGAGAGAGAGAGRGEKRQKRHHPYAAHSSTSTSALPAPPTLTLQSTQPTDAYGPRQQATSTSTTSSPPSPQTSHGPIPSTRAPPSPITTSHSSASSSPSTYSTPCATPLVHRCKWRLCTLSFSTTSDLMTHLSEEHVGSGKGRYTCEWEGCERSTTACCNGGVEGGSEKEDEDEEEWEKKREEREDKGVFRQRQKVVRHLQMHTGDRPHTCSVCGKSFSEGLTLTQHMRVHTLEKPYACDFPECGKSFALASALTIHKRTHTGSRPFPCPYPTCTASFSESSNLSKHIRTHTAEKRYVCLEPGCGKQFARSDQLKRHGGVHERRRGKAEGKGKEA
ncbi:hypothetical protein JCM11641_002214 [Rhodosporidiobolus odoratus]